MKRALKKRLYAVNKALRAHYQELCELSNQFDHVERDAIYSVAKAVSLALQKSNEHLGKNKWD